MIAWYDIRPVCQIGRKTCVYFKHSHGYRETEKKCFHVLGNLRTLSCFILPLEAVAQRCSLRKGVLRNFSKFAEKNLCQRLIFNKVADLSPATLLKKRPWHRCFPVNFAEFLRTHAL